MTKIHGTAEQALQSVISRKGITDERLEKLAQNYRQLQDAAKLELIESVIRALESGVPALQIAVRGLGYKQTNGIRSLFGLRMSGNLLELLRERRTELSGGALLGDTDTDTGTPLGGESIVYPIETGKGPSWGIERPGHGIIGWVNVMEGGGFWAYHPGNGVDKAPKAYQSLPLTPEERKLVYEAAGIDPDFNEWIGPMKLLVNGEQPPKPEPMV